MKIGHLTQIMKCKLLQSVMLCSKPEHNGAQKQLRKFMLLKLEWRETSSFFIPLTIINIINDYYFGHTQKTEGMKQDKDSIRKPWQSDKGTFRWVWVQHTEGEVHMRRKHPSLEWQLGQEWITSLHPSKQKGIKQHPTQHLLMKW